MSRSNLLPGMRPRVLQTRIEGRWPVAKPLVRQRPRHVSDVDQSFRAQDRQSSDRMHRLSAVQQRKTLFCFQPQRLQLRALERFTARPSFLFEKGFTFANQTE